MIFSPTSFACSFYRRLPPRLPLLASPLCKGERIEVRGLWIDVIAAQNPHATLSLEKGEAIHANLYIP